MHSIRWSRWSAVGAGLVLLLAGTVGCGGSQATAPIAPDTGVDQGLSATTPDDTAPDEEIPRFEMRGSQAIGFDSIDALAAESSNIVVARATGNSREVPLPEKARNPNVESAPNTLVTVTVTAVLSGADIAADDEIEVVSVGENLNTGHAALIDPGVYVLFLAPYVFGPGWEGGGYVVVGGPTGMYYAGLSGSDAHTFAKVDSKSGLPAEINSDTLRVSTGYTDAEYIASGGR